MSGIPVMQKPYIYENEHYYFEKLILIQVKSLSRHPLFDISFNALTPEYHDIFNNAWFNTDLTGLLKLMKKVSNPDPVSYKNLFWKLYYEVTEYENDHWIIDNSRLINALSTYPVIDACTVRASVDGYIRYPDKRIKSMEFTIRDNETDIWEKPGPYRTADLDYMTHTIRVLAQRKGFNLENTWEDLVRLQQKGLAIENGDRAEIQDHASRIIQKLNHWGISEAVNLATKLQRKVFA